MNRPIRIAASFRILFGTLLSLRPALSLAQQEPSIRVQAAEVID